MPYASDVDHTPKRKSRLSRRGQARQSTSGAAGFPESWRRSSDRTVGILHSLRAAPADLVELGRIVGPHGVRGHVKVLPHDPDSTTLQTHKTWWLRAAAPPLGHVHSARAVHVVSCKYHAGVLVVQIEGVDDRDQAQDLKGSTLHLPRSAFPRTADDEYYWVDLIGCDVHGQDAEAQDVLLGQVASVSDNGAHALLHVRAAPAVDAAQKRTAEQIIPFVAAHILRVSLAERRIDSNWPAGF